MKKFVLFSLAIFFVISCEPEYTPSGFGEFEGSIFLHNESNPLQGLGVRVSGNQLTYTNSEGYFYFPKVPEGIQKFEVLSSMDLIYSNNINILSDRIITIAIPLNSLGKPLPDFSVVDISKESQWDYWVVGKEEYFYIYEENSKPNSVLFHSFKTGRDCAILFDSKGLPSTVLADDYIFLFDNFNGNKVDLGILFPSGEFKVVREIKTDFVWDSSSKSVQTKAEFIRWTSRVIGAIPCVVSGAAAIVSGGFAIPLALWTCGNYFLGMANNFFNDADIKNGFTQFVEEYKISSTGYNCTANPDPYSCLISLANMGLSAYAGYVEKMEEEEARIAALKRALENNVPLKTISIQPGFEGKDAWVNLSSYSNCVDFYNHSGNDSLISVVLDKADIGCAKTISKMLIQFPIGTIPVNALVTSAHLEVYGYATINIPNGTPTITLSKIESSWSESTTTWIDDYYTEVITQVDFIPKGANAWHSFEVTSLVQSWVNGKENNFGFQIATYENTVYSEICSSDHPNFTKRPKLIISYY
jgi:hypothetical protein